MARFDVGGLDELSKDLASLASLPDEVLDGILDAEADVILQAQRSEIGSQWRGPYSQEISAKALKKGKVDDRFLSTRRGREHVGKSGSVMQKSLLSMNTASGDSLDGLLSSQPTSRRRARRQRREKRFTTPIWTARICEKG